MRLRLLDVRRSRIAEAIGACASDNSRLIAIVNEAQYRLILAGGETGWVGGWMKTVFNVDRTNPYITLPRDIVRIINLDYCRTPVKVQNPFYEFLEAGIGLQPSQNCRQGNCNLMETFDRGMYPTFVDLRPPNKRLRFYITEPEDEGKRILTQGTDQNGTTIVSLDGLVQVQGIFSSLGAPFVDTPLDIGSITGFQKDITLGQVAIYEVDTVTGVQRLLLTMDPSEEVAGYRRYFLNGLPRNCCDPAGPTTTVQVTAMAKLAFIPVKVDTDYCIIQNIPALKEECESVRYGEMDTAEAQTLSQRKHLNAIKLLNGELIEHLGKDRPAIQFSPFGTAKLRHQRIGALT